MRTFQDNNFRFEALLRHPVGLLGPRPMSPMYLRLLASIPSAFQKAQAALHLLERLEATPMRPSSIERGLVYALKHRYVPTAAEYVMNESQLTHSYAMEMDRLLADVKTTDATYSVKQCGFVWFICTISMYKLGWHARTPSYIMNMTIIMAIIMTIIVAIITIIMIMIMIKHAHHDDHDKFIITVSQG